MRRSDRPAEVKHIIIMMIILCQSLDSNGPRCDQEELRAAAAQAFNPVCPQLCREEHLQSYFSFTASTKTTQPIIIHFTDLR